MAPDSQHVDRAHAHHTHVATSSPTIRSSAPSSRRNSTRRRRRSSIMLLSPSSEHGGLSGSAVTGPENVLKHDHEDELDEIAISSTDKAAGRTITPFLSKHIPNTYNPMNQQSSAQQSASALSELAPSSNTKFCNRHRPDRKCRRQADGPSMDQLQKELSSLSHSDRSAISVRNLRWGCITPANDMSARVVCLQCCSEQAARAHSTGHPQCCLLQSALLHLGSGPRPHQDRLHIAPA